MEKDRTQESKERIIHLEIRVFPLLEIAERSGGMPVTVIKRGTCFLVWLAGNHVFVTAKHLLEEPPDRRDLAICWNTPDGRVTAIKVECMYVNHLKRDVSFFIPSPAMKESYESLLVPMLPLRHPLKIGQNVLTYGFPFKGQIRVVGEPPEISIHRTRHEGKVLEVEREYPLTPIGTVYRLDFPAPEGLSGSPVMVMYNGDLAVAGYVIGEQTTNGEPFAVSTDHSALMEIEQLLIEAGRATASSGD